MLGKPSLKIEKLWSEHPIIGYSATKLDEMTVHSKESTQLDVYFFS